MGALFSRFASKTTRRPPLIDFEKVDMGDGDSMLMHRAEPLLASSRAAIEPNYAKL